MAYIDTDGNRRDLQARWTVTARLTTTSASQIGVQEGDHADTTFGRDREGRLVLHGSNLAGALRSALNDRRAGYRKAHQRAEQDQDWARTLFGSMVERESPAIVFDSVSEKAPIGSIRDGVAIDPERRTAADKLKYDREVALPGLVFPLRIDVLVTKGTDEVALMTDLADALEALADQRTGGIRLGARKSRGLGRCTASDFRAIRYDLTTGDGWRAYAASDPEHPTAHVAAFPTPREAIEAVITLPASAEDKRVEAVFTFSLRVKGTLIIRSPGTAPTDPDAVHLSEQGASIVSGSSLAGVLRAHATRVVNTLDKIGRLAPGTHEIVGDIFGPSPQAVRDGTPPRASRLIVDEAVVEEARSHRHTRVKIDRFTGGAVDTALFEEMPAVKGNVSFRARLQNPCPAEVGLLVLVARDVLMGLVPIGGEAAVGRGTVTGSAELAMNGDVLEIPSPKSQGDVDRLQTYVDALVKNGDSRQ
ncbi:MAG: hypothetical protein GX446_04150 [Chthonomonadales bacterium]|nr:hypothetical protein [Chthonomonadales bacterium]